MAQYCSISDVDRWLPDNHGLDLIDLVSRGSALVDAGVSPIYLPFPDISATPATPALIRELAAMYAAHLGWLALSATNRFRDAGVAARLKTDADEIVEDLRASPPRRQIPRTLVTGEQMTTLGSDPLASNEYAFACAPADVEETSVSVYNYSGSVYTYFYKDSDFRVYLHPVFEFWVLAAIADGITSSSFVQYEYSHVRRRGIDLGASSGVVRLARA